MGGGLERTTSYYHLDREAAVRRDEERQFARWRTLAPGELRLPRDLYERRGIASSDEEEDALREKMVKGAVVLGARATSLVFGLPKHSSPDVKTIERRVKHIPIPQVTGVDSNTLQLAATPIRFCWKSCENQEGRFAEASDGSGRARDSNSKRCGSPELGEPAAACPESPEMGQGGLNRITCAESPWKDLG